MNIRVSILRLSLIHISPKEESLFADNDEFKVYDMTTSDYRGILYNFNNEYWQENADLIPAINYAIDRQAILDAVLLDNCLLYTSRCV